MTAAITRVPLNVTLVDNATEMFRYAPTVEFEAKVSEGQEPYSFDWDFKDGSPIEQGADANTSHTFTTPGLYNVTVNVLDSGNNIRSLLPDVVEDETADDQSAQKMKSHSIKVEV